MDAVVASDREESNVRLYVSKSRVREHVAASSAGSTYAT